VKKKMIESSSRVIEALVKSIFFAVMLVGAVITASGLIVFFSNFIGSWEGYVVVGLIMVLPGAYFWGSDRVNRVEIKGVQLKLDNKKGEKEEK
jgi:hypothetical protein